MMKAVDLNCDLGESFGVYKIGMDAQIIPYVSSVNIACGFHAADPVVMDETVARAAESGCAVGAHVGLPDIMGFGRRKMDITVKEAETYVVYQIGALLAFCEKHHLKLHHVKPHGALYNMAAVNYPLAEAICKGIKESVANVPLLALAGSQMVNAAENVGIRAVQEVFADRAYKEDGTLVSRNEPYAVIQDETEAVARVIRMVKDGKVKTIDGKDIRIQADSICVHGDNEKAFLFAKRIRTELEQEDIVVQCF